MGIFLKNVLLAFVLTSSLAAYGQFRFEDLTEDDVRDIIKDSAGLMTHSTASGASALGENFGFEFGLLATYAQTPDVERLVGDDGDDKFSWLPNAGLLGRVGVAQFLVLEMVYLPSTDFDDYNIEITSLAAQINILREEPFNLALKAFKTDGLISYEQIEPNMDLFVEMETNVTGAQALISKKYGWVEPFLGVGFINHEGEMRADGQGTIFNIVNVTASTHVDADGSSNHVFGGVELDLIFMNIGLEAARLYDNTRFSAKASLGF